MGLSQKKVVEIQKKAGGCPFCDGYIYAFEDEYESQPRYRDWVIMCNSCRLIVHGEGGTHAKAANEALKRWVKIRKALAKG